MATKVTHTHTSTPRGPGGGLEGMDAIPELQCLLLPGPECQPSFPAHQGERSGVLNPETAGGARRPRSQGVGLEAGMVLHLLRPDFKAAMLLLLLQAPAQACRCVPGAGVRGRACAWAGCTVLPPPPRSLGSPDVPADSPQPPPLRGGLWVSQPHRVGQLW